MTKASSSANPNDVPGAMPEPAVAPDASPRQPSAWAPPPPVARPRRPLLIAGLLVAAVVVALPLIATWILDSSPASGPSLVGVRFGTGGSDCTLTGEASSFKLGVPVRAVLTLSPPLAAGGSVTVKVELDGRELVEQGHTITVDEPAPCIHGTLSPSEVGHYRVEYTITPSGLPPVSGTFDVTP
jgi:hypothetical protein